MMKFLVLFSLFFCIALTKASPTYKQEKSREKYTLPEGAELLVGPVRSTFKCFADGYYADTDNNCQIFHICFTPNNLDGSQQQHMYSFLCGNQTIFNQLTFTCTYPEDAVPCSHAQDFYYLNSHLRSDDPEVHFLDEQDIERAAPFVSADFYGRRVEKPVPDYAVRRRFDFDKK